MSDNNIIITKYPMNQKEQLLKLSPAELNTYVIEVVKAKAESLDAEEALKFLFGIDNMLYLLEGHTSIRYGNGVHTKHKHINYHKFFQDNISSGDSVLDIGSSNGELTSDMAKAAAPGKVVGIEIVEYNYNVAIATYKAENLTFINGDATKDMPDEHFDIITLSNVLEHIEDRTGLLKTLNKKYQPKKFVLRVPLFERDWRVPLKKEIGIDYRLDETHFIEYTKEIFEHEMNEAGLDVVSIDIRWGEIWAVMHPKKSN